MESLLRFLAPAGPCGYLPQETWRLEYEFFSELSAAEYLKRMENGWRRFGVSVFRPQCPACNACRSLRVLVDRFQPNRSQRRVRKANEKTIRLQIGSPSVTRAKLELYDRYHAFQAETKGWPWHEPKDVTSYTHSFVENPFPTEEWCYYFGDRLVGAGYVDLLPGAWSAIYFFYDPQERRRSLGTWNVLNVIDRSRQAKIPYVYLGYYVEGCPSMEYKACFTPNQIRGPDGSWRDFRSR
jgi:arginyl-tRNA--protein-N-Asp/Glu arginylyltransferase